MWGYVHPFELSIPSHLSLSLCPPPLSQEAEASGQWPGSSLARQKVVTDETLAEQGGAGGTFTVGVVPGTTKQPKANSIFPGTVQIRSEQ
jgi:hypothetical protein